MIPSSFPSQDEIARLTASMFLEIEAVHLNTEQPFIHASGLPAPTYIDCRKLISFPRLRSTLMDFLTVTIMRNAGFEAFDVIAGGETAGIPYAAWIAEARSKPMLYVRKEPKGFGRDAQVEGNMEPGQRVLLVEDLATDGGSKVTFVDGLRNAGAEVVHIFVVFFYGAFPGAEKTMAGLGVTLHFLTTWNDVLKAAEEGQYFDQAAIDGVRDFLDHPVEWSKDHGGRDAG